MEIGYGVKGCRSLLVIPLLLIIAQVGLKIDTVDVGKPVGVARGGIYDIMITDVFPLPEHLFQFLIII